VSVAMEILIVTRAQDIPYLRYCVRSIALYARGFSGVTIIVPQAELKLFDWISGIAPLTLIAGYEHEGKGYLTHLVQKCFADIYCPDASYVLHLDADTVFIEAATPADFLDEGRPILYREKYKDVLNERRRNWQQGVHEALGILPEFEMTVRAPAVHRAELYGELRQAVQRHTSRPFNLYVMFGKSGQSDPPRDFSAFNALGALAIERFPDWYSFVDYDRKADAKRLGLRLSDDGWQYVYKRMRDKVLEVSSRKGMDFNRKALEKVVNRDAPMNFVR
jgi:hypothetical protein